MALGMVMLGKGPEVSGLSDLNMSDVLYHYMVGGHVRPMVSVMLLILFVILCEVANVNII
jgi:hypothetical protein